MSMLDGTFTQAFENSGIDYFIWFAPYKRFEHIEPQFELPKACVYKVGEMAKHCLLNINTTFSICVV